MESPMKPSPTHKANASILKTFLSPKVLVPAPNPLIKAAETLGLHGNECTPSAAIPGSRHLQMKAGTLHNPGGEHA